MNDRKDFSRDARENVPPAARGGDAEWAREQQSVSYLGRGIIVMWGGRYVAGVGRLGSGARSWALRACPLVLFVLPAKSEKLQL